MNRSGTLPKKEILRLIDSLRRQGCNIRHMRKGYRVEFPNGGSTMIHLTNSDSRGTLNTRAEIKRAGLIYPFDEPQQNRSKTVGKTLTDYQTEALRAVLNRIKEEGKFFGTIQHMANLAGVSEHTLNRRLHALGWTTEGRGPALVWYAPGARPAPELGATKEEGDHLYRWNGSDWVMMPEVEYPEIERAKKIVEANGRGNWPLVSERKFGVQTPPVGTVPLESDDYKVNVKATPPHVMPKATPAQVEEIVRRAKAAPQEREFIDSVESWTVPVPARLARMAEQMGLQIEVRVWR